MLIVGRLGTAALAASSIAFSLNMIVFLPMLGLGVGVSSLVGRYLGADDPASARRATWSAFWMSLGYFAACGAVYALLPRLLLSPFAAGADPAAFAEVEHLTVVLLRFVALYSIFDMMNVVFAAGLKGAGDTHYPLAATLLLGVGVMLGPAWVMVERFHVHVFAAWIAPTVYIAVLGVLMLRRFRSGRWESMRVIEPAPPDLVPFA
jgi:MATE family multidrug resistance protein